MELIIVYFHVVILIVYFTKRYKTFKNKLINVIQFIQIVYSLVENLYTQIPYRFYINNMFVWNINLILFFIPLDDWIMWNIYLGIYTLECIYLDSIEIFTYKERKILVQLSLYTSNLFYFTNYEKFVT